MPNKNPSLVKFALGLLIVILLSSCKSSNKEPEFPAANSLTLIFYMAGDDSYLSLETTDKIRAIANANTEALANPTANIFIYQDQMQVDGTPKLWRVKYSAGGAGSLYAELADKPTIECIREYTSQNSATKEVLAGVIDECLAIAPAEKYGLWIFSHGSGWIPKGKLISPTRSGEATSVLGRQVSGDNNPSTRTIITDGTNELEIYDLAAALPDNRFDFIVFEACLSGGIEVAYELKDKAKYLLVSSARIVSPGFTNVYHAVLPAFFNPSTDVLSALTKTAQEYFGYWDKQPDGYLRSATVSIIRTDALTELASVAREIFANGTSVSDINSIQEFEITAHKLFFDFEQYFSELATPAQNLRLSQSLTNAVVHKASTPYFFQSQPYGFQINHHSGLTAYIPQISYSFLNNEYKKLKWWQDTQGQ